MIDRSNIQAYIRFLHEKKHDKPAPDELVQQWAQLSDFEIIQQLQGLYQFWNIDHDTAALYERMFSMAAMPGSGTTLAQPVQEVPAPPETVDIPKRRSRKAWPFLLILLLLAGGAGALYLFILNGDKESPNLQRRQLQEHTDSLARQEAIEQQQQATRERLQREEMEKKAALGEMKSHLAEYVAVNATYNRDKMFGGISSIRVTVRNNSDFKMNEVTIALKYIKKNGELFESKEVKAYNILPHESTVIGAPGSNRGTELRWSVQSAQSDDLDRQL